MKNELQLVSYEQAVKLKKSGFDWLVNSEYTPHSKTPSYTFERIPTKPTKMNGYYPCPTVALALKWMRDVKILFGEIQSEKIEKIGMRHTYWLTEDLENFEYRPIFKTYEEAESALLDELLKIAEI